MITFSVRSNWDERSVACRVAAIIGNKNPWGDNHLPNKSDGKWQLDASNDWIMRKEEHEENSYSLSYRYGHSPERTKVLEGLKLFLEFIFS